jgi:hypothetical protein
MGSNPVEAIVCSARDCAILCDCLLYQARILVNVFNDHGDGPKKIGSNPIQSEQTFYSGCSSVRLERWFWEPEAQGSNPCIPIRDRIVMS